MNTVNIVLMMILCAMIGFALGNIWGKEVMKKTLSGLLKQLIEGMKSASSTGHGERKGE